MDLNPAQTAAGVKTWSNNAIFSSNVGIGTSSPAAALDVNGALKIASMAGQNISGNGYVKIGSLIIQWGSLSYSSNNPSTVTFPTAFTNLFSATATVDAGNISGSGANVPCKVFNSNTSSMRIAGTQGFSGDGASQVRWIAIGN